MVGLVLAKRWEKKNRNNFYRQSWEIIKIVLVCVAEYDLGLLKHFGIKSYVWSLDLAQKSIWFSKNLLWEFF